MTTKLTVTFDTSTDGHSKEFCIVHTEVTGLQLQLLLDALIQSPRVTDVHDKPLNNLSSQFKAEDSHDASVAAIQFALEADEGLEFLRLWNEGEFDSIRSEWPEAPEAVFIGADPLHVTS